jgi:hypothetical protein
MYVAVHSYNLFLPFHIRLRAPAFCLLLEKQVFSCHPLASCCVTEVARFLQGWYHQEVARCLLVFYWALQEFDWCLHLLTWFLINRTLRISQVACFIRYVAFFWENVGLFLSDPFCGLVWFLCEVVRRLAEVAWL